MKLVGGVVLGLGSKQYQRELYKYEKNLPPVPLKYTLMKLENILESLKPAFQSNFNKITSSLNFQSFKADLDPKIRSLADKILSLADNLEANQMDEAIENLNRIKENVLASLDEINVMIGNV